MRALVAALIAMIAAPAWGATWCPVDAGPILTFTDAGYEAQSVTRLWEPASLCLWTTEARKAVSCDGQEPMGVSVRIEGDTLIFENELGPGPLRFYPCEPLPSS